MHIMLKMLAAAALAVSALPAFAQDFPSRPLTFIYPFPAGSSADIAWRAIVDETSKKLGQPIAFENRPGAGGRVGFTEVVRSNPDGYTLGLVSNVTAVNQPLMDPEKWNVKPGKDFQPVVLGFDYPLILIASVNAPFKTMAELRDHAAKGDVINAGSAGVGSGPHLGVAALNHLAEIDIAHIPYAGNAPAITALLGGEIDVLWTDIAAKQHVDAGAVTPIAVAAPSRWSIFPGVPTTAEVGVDGLFLQSWSGVQVPRGTPEPVIDRLNSAFNAALKEPVLVDKLKKDGWNLLGGTPQDVTARIEKDQAFLGPIIKEAGIKPE